MPGVIDFSGSDDTGSNGDMADSLGDDTAV